MCEDNKPKVSIIDYGMGNLYSVEKACEHVGLKAEITCDKEKILNSAGVILPGVGAFGNAMDNLRRLDLVELLKDFAEAEKPFMGICLGMQLMMNESEEFGSHKGLNIFDGSVVRFPSKKMNEKSIKVPHIGWNRIYKSNYKNANKWDKSLLAGLEEGECMYFVHSFYVIPNSKDIILTVSSYGEIEYCSSIASANTFAYQFHPERSGEKGLLIYRNFSKLVKNTMRL